MVENLDVGTNATRVALVAFSNKYRCPLTFLPNSNKHWSHLFLEGRKSCSIWRHTMSSTKRKWCLLCETSTTTSKAEVRLYLFDYRQTIVGTLRSDDVIQVRQTRRQVLTWQRKCSLPTMVRESTLKMLLFFWLTENQRFHSVPVLTHRYQPMIPTHITGPHSGYSLIQLVSVGLPQVCAQRSRYRSGCDVRGGRVARVHGDRLEDGHLSSWQLLQTSGEGWKHHERS